MVLLVVSAAAVLIVVVALVAARRPRRPQRPQKSRECLRPGPAYPGVTPDHSIGEEAAKQAEQDRKSRVELEARLAAEKVQKERELKERRERDRIAAEKKAKDDTVKVTALRGKILGFCADYDRAASFPRSGVIFASSTKPNPGRSRTIIHKPYWDEWMGSFTESTTSEQIFCTHNTRRDLRVYPNGQIAEHYDESCTPEGGYDRCGTRQLKSGKTVLDDSALLRRHDEIESGLRRCLTEAIKRNL